MKDIRGIKGKFYIASLIEEGEYEHQDFKFAVSDARKIARSLSAFANNDGGRLLIGVKDNGAIAGVRNERISSWWNRLPRCTASRLRR
ncbi:helix-turn-helix domain-containing protein [uncultured Duncaniella sp.]|uniref:AlbA family DNA-binding domain-containing protein n=1 Tax=uncultured Duncaniella sp. TaxID=2768039 RepID=UPI002657DE18|nr:ATP-binding protein [uncultured Duncaniella sp.]